MMVANYIVIEIIYVIGVQIELITGYISADEGRINDASDRAFVLTVLAEIIEVLCENKFINGTDTYYFESSFITYPLEFIMNDIVYVLQASVISTNIIYT